MVDVHPDTLRDRGDPDAARFTTTTAADDARTMLLNRLSWSAVLGGVVVALVTQLILNMFGIGIGAATLDPSGGAVNNPSVTSFSVGAGIWWALSGILAALAGGYTAGRLAGRPQEAIAGWHGLTAWALTTLVIFYLLTSSIGGIIGGAYNTLSNAVGTAASTAGGAVQSAVADGTDPFASIERTVRGTSGGDDPGALRDNAIAAMRAVISGDPAQAGEARERATQALARAQNISVEQARTQVAQYEQQYRQAVETAKARAAEAADVAAHAVSRGALFAAISLVLGAIAAWLGGRMGAVESTISHPFGAHRQATIPADRK
ncbi:MULTISPECIES: PhnA-like protein [Rhodomicrobium]|uniref:PhnA-like protein n=1 Tax=Rhodomicrobium TaxID=1068 RepID=UPI000B4B8BAB|nr:MULTISPECIES: PhnA-like protein [Rhodomicrobium]